MGDEIFGLEADVVPVVGREVEAAQLDLGKQVVLTVVAGQPLVPAAVGPLALAVEGRVAAQHYVPDHFRLWYFILQKLIDQTTLIDFDIK